MSESINEIAAICQPQPDLVKMMAALGHETRLQVFKISVEIGQKGTCPCHIAEALKIARNNLSFHLNLLTQAGLAEVKREGKYLYYSPNLENLRRLTDYLWAEQGLSLIHI